MKTDPGPSVSPNLHVGNFEMRKRYGGNQQRGKIKHLKGAKVPFNLTSFTSAGLLYLRRNVIGFYPWRSEWECQREGVQHIVNSLTDIRVSHKTQQNMRMEGIIV